ncbi:MAG: efflux RND transporter permease subunit [Candidatus Gracilibacteria bacterium]
MEKQELKFKPLSPIAKLIRFFLTRDRITVLVAITFTLWGVLAYFSMPREQIPEINIPIAIVSTMYPGASPQDIETQVTDKLESKLSELDQIDTLTSTSSFSMSMIVIQFETGVDMDLMTQKIQNKIGEVENELPADAESPTVGMIESSDLPVLDINLMSEKGSEFLTDQAEWLQDELEKITGVSDVTISGGVGKEIQINVSASRLALYGLSLAQITPLFEMESVNFPVGDITIDNQNYTVRIQGEFTNLTEIENLVIGSSTQGAPIYLRDIATVEETFKETTSYARLSQKDETGEWVTEPSITLSVYKKKDSNIVDIGDEIKSKIEQWQIDGSLSDNVSVAVTGDWAEETKKEINNMFVNVGESFLIVGLILFLYLGLLPSLISAFVIPLSMATTFGLLWYTGYTINGLTLFALVLVLGMVVDSGIIMVENIFRLYHQAKGDRKLITLHAADEIAVPLITSVLTTIASFLPMAFMTGIVGEYIKVIPMTVIFALGSSMVIGLVLTPYFTYRMIPKKLGPTDQTGLLSGNLTTIKKMYRDFVAALLESRFKRWAFLAGLTGLFLSSFLLPATGLVRTEMFPGSDSKWVTLNISLPQGTSLEKSDEAAQMLTDKIKTVEGIRNFVTLVGTSGASTTLMDVSGGSAENTIYFSINLVDPEDRELGSGEIVEEIRTLALDISYFVGATLTFAEQEKGPPSGDPIVFRIQGEDSTTLENVANDLANLLETVPGTVEVDNGIQEKLKEYEIVLNREKIQLLGLNTATVAATLRALSSGQNVGIYRENNEELDVILQLKESDRDTLDDLKRIMIPSSQGLISLDAIASIELGGSPSSVAHYDLKKTITVSSKITPGANSAEILKIFKQELSAYPMPEGYSVTFGGETEDINESFGGLYNAMWIAVVLIYIILVAQFNSLIQPFIILTTLPLSVIGVFAGLFIMDYGFSFPSFIGVVALGGIVVNNAIMIIDRMNSQRSLGMPLKQAVLEGVNLRFRPILLTTLTTIIGVIPTSLQDEVWGSLGFTIVFGLAFSTVLTLIVIPVLYYMVESRKEPLGQARRVA